MMMMMIYNDDIDLERCQDETKSLLNSLDDIDIRTVYFKILV